MQDYDVQSELIKVPFLTSAFQCGFGTPFADGFEYLMLQSSFVSGIKDPYLIRATGDSMSPTITEGDILLLDHGTVSAKDKDLVAAMVNGGFVIKEYRVENFSTYLVSHNSNYSKIKISSEEDVVFGVIHHLFRRFK
jgi:SOS-response transcriptional repressor LexA